MILSDKDITQLLLKNGRVCGVMMAEDQVQPSSLDVRLARTLMVQDDGVYTPVIDSTEPFAFSARTYDAEGFVLKPGHFALGSTVEHFSIPEWMAGQVNGRSSLGRIGLVVHVTAGFIDPGFVGNITLELANVGRQAIILHAGMRIAQIAFVLTTTPATLPYGHRKRQSKYQGQEGVTNSRMREHTPEERWSLDPFGPITTHKPDCHCYYCQSQRLKGA